MHALRLIHAGVFCVRNIFGRVKLIGDKSDGGEMLYLDVCIYAYVCLRSLIHRKDRVIINPDVC